MHFYVVISTPKSQFLKSGCVCKWRGYGAYPYFMMSIFTQCIYLSWTLYHVPYTQPLFKKFLLIHEVSTHKRLYYLTSQGAATNTFIGASTLSRRHGLYDKDVSTYSIKSYLIEGPILVRYHVQLQSQQQFHHLDFFQGQAKLFVAG